MMLRQMLESFLRPAGPAANAITDKSSPPPPAQIVDHDARLIEQLRLHEGERKKPYRDTVGKLTIGIGRKIGRASCRERV